MLGRNRSSWMPTSWPRMLFSGSLLERGGCKGRSDACQLVCVYIFIKVISSGYQDGRFAIIQELVVLVFTSFFPLVSVVMSKDMIPSERVILLDE